MKRKMLSLFWVAIIIMAGIFPVNTKAAVDTSYSNQFPHADFTYSPSLAVTYESMKFDASASYDSDGEIVSYQWDWNNDGTYDSTGKIVYHSWTKAGNHTIKLKVTDDKGASTIKWETINIRLVKVDFNMSIDNPTFMDEIKFYDGSVIDPNLYISSRKWNFGDGVTSYDQNPTHRYEKDGKYKVKLTITVSDGKGAAITASKTREISVDIAPGTIFLGKLNFDLFKASFPHIASIMVQDEWHHAALYTGDGNIVEADPHIEKWTVGQRVKLVNGILKYRDGDTDAWRDVLEVERETKNIGGVEADTLSQFYKDYSKEVVYGIPKIVTKKYPDNIMRQRDVMAAAAKWAKGKAGILKTSSYLAEQPKHHPFDWVSYYINDTKQVDENDEVGPKDKGHGGMYYCTELVWASYAQQFLYMEYKPSRITPTEVYEGIKIIEHFQHLSYNPSNDGGSDNNNNNASDINLQPINSNKGEPVANAV